MEIRTLPDLRKAMETTRDIYPGGYEYVFLASGGGELCRKCVYRHYMEISRAVLAQDKQDSWYVYGVQSTAEMDGPVICDECDKILLEAP